MQFTKQQVQQRADVIRQSYKKGILSSLQIFQYESLPGWFWSRVFMPFVKARTLARAQEFSGKVEFEQWKKPLGMPSNPQTTYKTSGWSGYGDFLGTERTRRQTEFMSFKKARTLVIKQQFTCMREFANWKKPVGMPSAPWRTYKTSGWSGYGDFLGTRTVQHGKENWMTFKKARALARSQCLSGKKEFQSWKKPIGMPCRPNTVYKQSGWIGYGDFLGSNRPKHRDKLGRYTK